MLTVACVLKHGGTYLPEHVAALQMQVRRHLTIKHRFVCLSDLDVPCERIPLVNNWRGWWSKMNLFDINQLAPPWLYIDLDTIIVRNIDDLARHPHTFTVLSNFWGPGRFGSGLMACGIPLTPLYEAFKADPDSHMQKYMTTEKWGDQGFIQFNTPVEPDRWQQLFPGRIVSYKAHCRQGDMRGNGVGQARIPDGANIVCYHGPPRPWETPFWEEYVNVSV